MSKVLVLGGYGVFGTRIARRLALFDGCEVFVGGRDLRKAVGLCCDINKVNPNYHAVPVQVDTEKLKDLTQLIKQNDINTVIHTAGPFLPNNYSVARAIIEAGCHYIDIADNRNFVCNFDELDELAKKKSVICISGASSVPGISSAIVTESLPLFECIDKIDIGINPGNQTPRGEATIASILSYCGKDIKVFKDGKQSVVKGWRDTMSIKFPPPIGYRYVSNCDVPDLQIFPTYFNCKTVTFQAGLELSILHFATSFFSVLVQSGLISNMATYASPLKTLSELFLPFGSTTGAMFVIITGKDKKQNTVVRKIFLCADGGRDPYGTRLSPGPEIPCTPAVILAGNIAKAAASGDKLPYRTGAYACMSLFMTNEVMQSLHLACSSSSVWLVNE